VNHSGIDIQEFKATLLALRDELASIGQAESDAKHPVELDQSRVGRLSRMDALQVQAMSVESFRRKKLQRQRVEAALTRIAKDEFGLCLECGEEINPKRLEFDPTFLVCIDCAEAREQ
jgi:DnaK suppressor protein